MGTQTTTLVIDAGNSFLKLALFESDQIQHVDHIDLKALDATHPLVKEYGQMKGILSSVRSDTDTKKIFSFFPNLTEWTPSLQLPVALNYDTPDTLGKDRICNAVGAWFRNPHHNSVCIDIGTCIKFDVVTADGAYQGGSISPGIRLRYQSMHDYTARLPLMDERAPAPLIGKSTHGSMHSGVINGMQAEINALITRYTQQLEHLTFFMTGGDLKYFDFHPKNNIFAIENLTLEGLYQIYLFNAE